MKKIIGHIMILCLAAVMGLNAQTEKGKFLLGVSSRTSLIREQPFPDRLYG